VDILLLSFGLGAVMGCKGISRPDDLQLACRLPSDPGFLIHLNQEKHLDFDIPRHSRAAGPLIANAAGK
jgi:hypothetical protein